MFPEPSQLAVAARRPPRNGLRRWSISCSHGYSRGPHVSRKSARCRRYVALHRALVLHVHLSDRDWLDRGSDSLELCVPPGFPVPGAWSLSRLETDSARLSVSPKTREARYPRRIVSHHGAQLPSACHQPGRARRVVRFHLDLGRTPCSDCLCSALPLVGQPRG